MWNPALFLLIVPPGVWLYVAAIDEYDRSQRRRQQVAARFEQRRVQKRKPPC